MRSRRCTEFGLSLCILIGGASVVHGQQAVFLLRHAERAEYESRDGVLSEAGEARARALARVLQDAGVTAIYTSQLKRTIQTAEPLAKALGIMPTPVAAPTPQATLDLIRKSGQGGAVAIIGHGDTVPAFLKALGHPGEVTIGSREHDDLFVIVPAGGQPTVVRLNY